MTVVELCNQMNNLELDTIVAGPSSEGKEFDAKVLKKVVKEGGKRGVEIEGAADMGGLQFFCTNVLEPQADIDLLVESMKAMNAKSDPSEEERKGGAGKLGKIIMSATEQKIALVAYVPSDKTEKCKALEWLNDVVLNSMGSKALVEAGAKVAACDGVSADNYATAVISNNPEKGVFCMKFRDTIISMAYQYLRARDLFPADDEESDDEFVFGDEYFPEEEEPVKETYDLLCPIAERLTTEKMEKKLKKILKEGGKRGVEIEGAADMGGLQFFCTQMEGPAGDIDCLVESMRAMNAKSDPSEEERKGGAGNIGKTILSMDDSQICFVCYVPEALADKCSASDWLENTLKEVLATGNDFVGDKAAVAKSVLSSYEGNETTFAKAVIEKNGEKALFPLKMKDAAINSAYAYLKSKGLFPDGDDDDEEDYVFGDEDFPEC